jgi:hypothetical protein
MFTLRKGTARRDDRRALGALFGEMAKIGMIKALTAACEPPEKSELPLSHWSQSELARDAVRRGIVDSISHGSVGRFLKRGRPQTASRARLARAQAGP